jgi:AraC-like DNA-binding protein
MDARILEICRIVKSSPEFPHSVESLANAVNLSCSRAAHLFKTETGVSIKQYVLQVRMTIAHQMIVSSFLSIKEIMHKVGIYDKSYFVKSYRKVYGITPSQVRVNSGSVPLKTNPNKTSRV